MAPGHPQAYFDSTEVLASSDALDPAALLAALPADEGLRVTEIEGLGLVAARRVGEFTHVIAGVSGGAELFDAPFWRVEPGPLELDEIEPRPVDLGFLADAPPGVAARLLEAALEGPVAFSHPDDERRAAWIAWLTYALPGGAGLTFSTAGDDGVRVSASAEAGPDAIDTTEPCDLSPTLYARVAQVLAMRGELREAAARLEEPDGLALAVYGGATDLLAPHQLPLALQLITELAAAGEVQLAARAAAALPTGAASMALVLHEEPPLPARIEPEPDEIVDAEVVEEGPIHLEEGEVIEVPFEPAPAEPPLLLGEGEVVEVPFEFVVDAEPEGEDLPDLDAWDSLLSELKAESVAPEPELSVELGRSLEAFAASLSQAPEPEPVEEREVGMSLSDLEASLAPEPEHQVVEEQEVGMSLAELEASLKRGEQP